MLVVSTITRKSNKCYVCFPPVPPETTEVVSTPLLEYIRNKRAERQRIRDEKREEKRKKDLERRKAKEEQKKIKKDEDSVVVKVIAVNSINGCSNKLLISV